MIYLTTSNLSLLIYHCFHTYQQQPLFYKSSSLFDISYSLSQPGVLNHNLTSIIPHLSILDYDGPTPPSLSQVCHNVTYIKLDELTQGWKRLIQESEDYIKYIEIQPNLYKFIVEPFRALFSQDAFDYFWEVLCLDKFKTNPNKWNAEITSLLIRKKNYPHRYTVEDLENIYYKINPDLFNRYLSSIGTSQGTRLLYSMSDSQLWSMFIGSPSKPPSFKRYLEHKKADTLSIALSYVQLSVEYNCIDLRLACCIFNEWIKDNSLSLNSHSSYKSIDKLKQLLYL